MPGCSTTGIMGFVALGGLAVVLISAHAGAGGLGGGRAGHRAGAGAWRGWRSRWRSRCCERMAPGRCAALALVAVLVGGVLPLSAPSSTRRSTAIEANNPAARGQHRRAGPADRCWPGRWAALLAAAAAWVDRQDRRWACASDYLAIATLGIAEIIIAVLQERGLAGARGEERHRPAAPLAGALRGRPADRARAFWTGAASWGFDPVTTSSIIWSSCCYAGLFGAGAAGADLAVGTGAEQSPWGRMMRAIRDNEVSAEAMGKDVTRRHLQIFILGSAVVGLAGAMMTSMDGQLTPGHLHPAALHLPDLGDGDRRRVGQQLGRGAGRAADRLAVAGGRIPGAAG